MLREVEVGEDEVVFVLPRRMRSLGTVQVTDREKGDGPPITFVFDMETFTPGQIAHAFADRAKVAARHEIFCAAEKVGGKTLLRPMYTAERVIQMAGEGGLRVSGREISLGTKARRFVAVSLEKTTAAIAGSNDPAALRRLIAAARARAKDLGVDLGVDLEEEEE